MNFQQLEYLVALSEELNFSKAAERCHVTQPTLSMMIQKMEEDLGMVLIDRKVHPISITQAGKEVLRRSREILLQLSMLKQWAKDHSEAINGTVKLGCIPTVAPYILPQFLKEMSTTFNQLEWEIQELQTKNMIAMIKNGNLDVGILALPVKEVGLEEMPLFKEDFILYHSGNYFKTQKRVGKKDLKGKSIWLMEEGHCLRDQVYSFCNQVFEEQAPSLMNYKAGSIETLIRMVDNVGGLTFLPKMALTAMNSKELERTKIFENPKPGRVIGLVYREDYPRHKVIHAMKAHLKQPSL